MSRNQDLVGLVRRLAGTELDNTALAAAYTEEISDREMIPQDAQGRPLPPTDETLFEGDNADLTPEAFLQAGLAARVQLLLVNTPADALAGWLTADAPPALQAGLAALGNRTVLGCYRRARR